MDYSPPGSSVHGILQARILEWVAMPSSKRDLPDSGIEPTSLMSPALAGGLFTTRAIWEAPYININHFIYVFMHIYIYIYINHEPTSKSSNCMFSFRCILSIEWLFFAPHPPTKRKTRPQLFSMPHM